MRAGLLLGTHAIVLILAALLASPSLARPGDLDPSFAGDGIQIIEPEAGSAASELEVLPDDRILTAGRSYLGPDYGVFISRFLPDGTPDLGFGMQGTEITQFGDLGDDFDRLTALPDGRILLSGQMAGSGDRYVARLLPDGSPDLSFDGDGVRAISAVAGERIVALLRQPGGELIVVVGGSSSYDPPSRLIKLSSSGELDQGFSGDGVTEVPEAAGDVGAATLDQQGRILTVGGINEQNCAARASVARLLPESGEIDPGFGDDGALQFDPDYAYSCPTNFGIDIQQTPDGSIFALAGFHGYDGVSGFHFTTTHGISINEDGKGFPRRFTEGSRTEAFLAREPQGVTLVSDGYTSNQDFTIVLERRANGEDDPAFENDSRPELNLAFGSESFADLAAQSDGRIVAVGSAEGRAALFRLREDAAPADADADGRRDAEDRCPGVPARSDDGCNYARRGLRLSKGPIPGIGGRRGGKPGVIARLRSRGYECTRGPVQIYRKLNGRVRRIGNAHYSEKIKTGEDAAGFGLAIADRRGAFFARAPEAHADLYEICPAVRSKPIAFGGRG